MKLNVQVCVSLILFLFCFFMPTDSNAQASASPDDVIIENTEMRLVIGCDGISKSLLHKPTGQECLDAEEELPVCALTQYRPYDNENFLMFPAKPRTFPANKIRREGDELFVEFEDTYDIAVIGLNITDDYIGFTLNRVDYSI